MNKPNAIATPEQISDKIEFVTVLDKWSTNQFRDFIKAEIRLRSGNTDPVAEGVIVRDATLDISVVAKSEMQLVPRGTLFKVTIERVS